MKEQNQSNMRKKIIDKSIKLFLRKSFKGTSIQDITNALNITKGAFYWHFKSKDELLETIIDKYEREFLDSLLVYFKQNKDNFLKFFRDYHKYISEYALKNSEICVLATTLSAELAGSGVEAEKKLMAVYAKYLNFIESMLNRGKEENLFYDNFDTILNAHIIVAIHNGVLLQWYMNKKKIDGTSLARTYRDVILFGMVNKQKGQ